LPQTADWPGNGTSSVSRDPVPFVVTGARRFSFAAPLVGSALGAPAVNAALGIAFKIAIAVGAHVADPLVFAAVCRTSAHATLTTHNACVAIAIAIAIAGVRSTSLSLPKNREIALLLAAGSKEPGAKEHRSQ
jgi:hypothetical protein